MLMAFEKGGGKEEQGEKRNLSANVVFSPSQSLSVQSDPALILSAQVTSQLFPHL